MRYGRPVLPYCLDDAVGRVLLLRGDCLARGGAPVLLDEVEPEVERRRHAARGHHAPVLDDKYWRSEEHTSELQSLAYLVCRLLLEKKKRPCRGRRRRGRARRSSHEPA